MTNWPIWEAYRRLWWYAQAEKLKGKITVPTWLDIYPRTDLQIAAVAALDKLLTQAYEAAPLNVPNQLYTTYCYLFVQLVRVNLPNGVFFTGTQWKNLSWFPIQSFVGVPGVSAWKKWHYEVTAGGVTNPSQQTLELKILMPPEAGALDEMVARTQAQALKGLRLDHLATKHPIQIMREFTPDGEPNDGNQSAWHPWVVLAQPEAYADPAIKYGIQIAVESLITNGQRWKTFTSILPELRPDVSPRILCRAILVGMDNVIKPHFNTALFKLWRNRRRRLLSSPLQRARRYNQKEQ